MDERDALRNAASARRYVDETLGKALTTPNHGILITNGTFPHRKFATLDQQLRHDHLTDFEIRDMFSGPSNQIDYGNLIDQSEHHQTHGQASHNYHGQVNGMVHGHFTANEGRLNNLVYLALNGGTQDAEWVTIDGGYGHTSIEPSTRNYLHAMNKARRLIQSTTPYDLIWFIRYDPRTKAWQTLGATLPHILRQAVILGMWPYYTRGSY